MPLCSRGHIATAADLRRDGWTRARLADAEIVRLRRGVYACAHLSGPLTVAATAGGAITCATVLRESGVWAGFDSRVHVQVPSSASGRVSAECRFHWEPPRFGMETAWRVSAIQALWQAIRCLDEENAIAALESAIANGFVPRADLNRLCVLAPRRLQGGIRLLIPNSGSGNETIARLRLIRAGYSVAAQGTVPGLGRQDLVINGCVGIEVDSALWHGEKQRLNDVERDLRAEGFGRRTLRIYPTHIHKSWSRTLAVIDRMVRDANRGRIATRRDAAGF